MAFGSPYRLSALNLKTVNHLSLRIDIPEKLLNKIGDNPLSFYCPERKEKKPSGGERPINEPKPLLKSVQKKINRMLQEIKLPPNFYGAVKNRSNIDNAAQHTHKKYVANFDIEEFFPSIPYGKVRNLFIKLSCIPKVATLLAKLTTCEGRVPQGAPTSSTLANLVLAQHEPRFRELARQFGLTVTFFQDDVTFSGQMDISRIKNLVIKIFSQLGFQIHKDEKLSIKRNDELQTVTGLTVNKKVNAPRNYIRELRSVIYILRKKGSNTINIDSIKGKISYVQRVNPNIGNKLLQDFNEAISLGKN